METTPEEAEEAEENGEEEEEVEEESVEEYKIKLSTLEKDMLSSDLTDESREKNYVYILALKDKMTKTLLEHAKREEKDKRFLVAATVPSRGIDPFTSYLGDMNVRAKDL